MQQRQLHQPGALTTESMRGSHQWPGSRLSSSTRRARTGNSSVPTKGGRALLVWRARPSSSAPGCCAQRKPLRGGARGLWFLISFRGGVHFRGAVLRAAYDDGRSAALIPEFTTPPLFVNGSGIEKDERGAHTPPGVPADQARTPHLVVSTPPFVTHRRAIAAPRSRYRGIVFLEGDFVFSWPQGPLQQSHPKYLPEVHILRYCRTPAQNFLRSQKSNPWCFSSIASLRVAFKAARSTGNPQRALGSRVLSFLSLHGGTFVLIFPKPKRN